MGDFNRNMLNPDNQTNAFVDEFFSFGFFLLINKPTRISTAATLIDNIWTNNLKYVTKSAIVVDLIADHFGVVQSTTFTNCFAQKTPCTQIRCFSNKNVKKFLNQLQNISWEEIYEDSDPDHAFNILLYKIQSCFNESFPLCNASKKRSKLKSWFDAELRQLHKTKRSAYYRYLRKKNKETKTTYNKIKNHYERVIRTKKSFFYKTHLDSVRNNLKETWRTIYEIIGQQKPCPISSINHDYKTYTDSHTIAEIFNNYFSTVANDLIKNMNSDNKHATALPQPISASFYLYPITVFEIKKNITLIKSTNSCGLDDIPPKILKLLPDTTLGALAHIFNLSFVTSKYISAFKSAKVTPIFKKGNRQIVSNYRPISILSAFLKVMEKAVFKRMIGFINANHILSNFQFGFRPLHSTNLACNFLNNLISECFNNNNAVLTIFLDMTKAFDSLNHKILLSKLDRYGFRGQVNNWFCSYLCGRTQTVCLNNSYSQPRLIMHGVPQGSILGPLLFLIYINDVFLDCGVKSVLYADDATLVIPGKSVNEICCCANATLQLIYQRLTDNKLTVNCSKTKYMLLSPQPYRLSNQGELFPIRLNESVISEVKEFKFLGLHLANNLKWSTHINFIRNKLRVCLGIIYRARDRLNTQCLLSIFHSLALLHINYCISIWCTSNATLVSSLQSLCNKILRVIFYRNNRANIDDLYKKYKILKIIDRYKFEVCCFVYKYFHKLLPTCFNNTFQFNSQICSRQTRSSNLLRPPSFTKTVCRQAISYRGALYWNELPSDIKSSTTFQKFKHNLKCHLLSCY